MPRKSKHKQFVSQFSLPEWKRLCKHRLFLHFLRTNLKLAASIAADALQRPVRYIFPAEEAAPNKVKKMRKAAEKSRRSPKSKHRRFRL